MPRENTPTAAPARPGTQPPDRERGSTALELVVVFPAVLLLLFGIVQGGLWYHARNVAGLAAAEGLRAAQAKDGSADAGRAQAAGLLARVGAQGVLTGLAVTAERGSSTAAVTVSGRAPALFPGLQLSVTRSASGPVERFLKVYP